MPLIIKTRLVILVKFKLFKFFVKKKYMCMSCITIRARQILFNNNLYNIYNCHIGYTVDIVINLL